MKRVILFTSLFLAGFFVRAQNGNRIEVLKIAYITNRLNLSPEEAQRFWPIYNQYSLELKVARLKAADNKSTEIELDESLLNIRKKYNVLFNQILPPQKVDIFFKSEKEFGHFVQKEMELRQQRQQQKHLENNP